MTIKYTASTSKLYANAIDLAIKVISDMERIYRNEAESHYKKADGYMVVGGTNNDIEMYAAETKTAIENERIANAYNHAADAINDALYAVGIDYAAKKINDAYMREDNDAYEHLIDFYAKMLQVSPGMVEDAATDYRLYGRWCG